MNTNPSIGERITDIVVKPVDTSSSGSIDVYALSRRALRGRVGLCIALAVIGAFIGAIIGCNFTRPLYKSEGLVRIAYALPAILQETDQNKPVAMYDSFLRSQQLRISSRNLVEQALKNPIWRETGRGESPSVIADFASQLAVEHPAGTEHIRVTYTDADPAVASAAVRAIVSTFKQIYDQQDQQLQKQRIAVLNDRRHDLMDTLGDVGSRADQLALMDSLLAEYIKRQSSMENELKLLQVQGYMENHRRVAELRSMLDRTSAMIAQYSDMARKLRDLDREYAAVTTPTGTNPFETSTATPAASLQSGELWQGDARSRRDLIAVQGNLMQMQRLQADSDNIRKELAETTQRMEALKVESGLGGRLEVISDGDAPLAPFRDRRAAFAGAGALAGATVPWALFIALGTLCPIYRRSEDVTEELGERLPLLGTLPRLTERINDLTLAAGAAQSIHQTRLRLQRLRDYNDLKVILFTSPCAGEGKTSLTTALGLSFAASGSRTLIIDLDFIGRRLSRGFRLEKRTGAFEALTKGEPLSHLREIAPSLSVMPAGAVDSEYACTISATSLRSMLDELRDSFDVILIDGGPALGSVETSLAAPIVDGIVLAISRGQDPLRVQRTINHLSALGGRMAGMVFNRAEANDFTRSSYRPSQSSASLSRDRSKFPIASVPREGGLKADLLVKSVMTFLPAALSAAHDVSETQAGAVHVPG